MEPSERLVIPLNKVGMRDVGVVGGKNASLGELIQHLVPLGVRVPGGFAATAAAYWQFLDANDLRPKIAAFLARFKTGRATLDDTGERIRAVILRAKLPPQLVVQLRSAYRDLCLKARRKSVDVAVRSSATAEDLPVASFAGQLESYLNVRGEDALLTACRRCFASLFTDRAISYRDAQGFDHMKVALSIGVQCMVRSDKSGAGVMFSIDTETGFPRTILINAAWGLGEYVVKGVVDPDQYVVFKPLVRDRRFTPIISKTRGRKERKLIYSAKSRSPTVGRATNRGERESFVLNDKEIMTLARWAVAVENHYKCPMDLEWAKDGTSDELFLLQARPETIEARREAASLKTYTIKDKGKRLLSGLAIGSSVAVGEVCQLKSPRDGSKFKDGAILVAEATDPDWGPIMKRAAAIVTAHGGRTSHAAIVSRELGVPAIVGAAGATRTLKNGMAVTVSCAEGDEGYVYAGRAKVKVQQLALDEVPRTRTKVMLNMANPAAALNWWRLPADGIGLARMEFIISNHIKIHPLALTRFAQVKSAKDRRLIQTLTRGYKDKGDYFVDRLAQGIARLAASQYPRHVIVRLSDFKTNEYASLIGGTVFEPHEPNPMIGWRGASRYYSEGYRDGFALECRAIRKVREEMGLTNVVVMVPFCRTLKEADLTLHEMARHGLKRGEKGLEIYVMCEIPSNVILGEVFAKRFDGFSIGSNDLTQLTLGVDRDLDLLSDLFDEEDPAVTTSIRNVIRAVHGQGRHIGLCGQAPSDRPKFARFLVEAGIDSMSVTPDSFLQVKANAFAAEQEPQPHLNGRRRVRAGA